MLNFIKEHWIEILGLLGGGGLLSLAIKVFKKTNKVEQKGNKVGGDMAGRDINKK